MSCGSFFVNGLPVSGFRLEPLESSSSIVMAGFGGLSEAEIEEGISILRRAWL